MKHLFFDCETGGLLHNVSTILTAYFSVHDDQLNLIDELYLQLKPNDIKDLCVEEEALKVTGINLVEHLADPQTVPYCEGKKTLLAFFEKHKTKGLRRHYRPCGQNIEFDIKFITAQLLTPEEWGKYVHYNTLDTLRILTFLQDIGFLPVDLGNLGSLVQYFNIPMGQAHNCKEDVKMTVEVYKAMKQMLLAKKNDFSGANSSLFSIVED